MASSVVIVRGEEVEEGVILRSNLVASTSGAPLVTTNTCLTILLLLI